MATSFNSIQADVQSQLNAIVATTPAIAEAAYASIVGGTSVVGDRRSTDWGLLQIQAALLDSEYELLKEIAFNKRHVEHSDLSKVSSPLVNQDRLPAVAADTTPFLGIFDFAKEGGTNTPLTERPMQIVQWAIANADSVFSNPRVLVWCIAGGTIMHNSATSILLVGPAVARATVTVNTFTPANIRLRDYHRPAIVAGAMTRLLPKKGANSEAFSEFSGLYAAHIAQIRGVDGQVAAPYPAR